MTNRFNDSKPQNVPSFLMQAAGDAVPDHNACEKCARNTGVYPHCCVVVRDPSVLEVTGGACANCWYSRQGSQCTFRLALSAMPQQTPARPRNGHMRETTAPGSESSRRHQPSPNAAGLEEPDATGPAPAPLHPGYAAALASGTAAVASGSTAALHTHPAQTNNLSRDEKVRLWESRYSNMSTANLLQAHEHLAEWQEDLTTRLMAINRVVLDKLRARDDRS